MIVTLGLGFRPTQQSSIDLVAHDYRQEIASTRLRGAALAADPSGLSRRLGSELDLVVGYDGVVCLEVKGVLSYFIPGQAFPEADGSVFASVKTRVEMVSVRKASPWVGENMIVTPLQECRDLHPAEAAPYLTRQAA